MAVENRFVEKISISHDARYLIEGLLSVASLQRNRK